MSKGRYNYYDPEYNPQITDGNELLIAVNDTSFSFVIMQTETKRVLVWGEEYPESELLEPADLKHILTARYDSVKAVIQSTSFVLIPKPLYSENEFNEYRKFLTLKPGDKVLVNELDANNYVIFKVNEAVVKNLEKYVDFKSVFFAGKAFNAAVSFEIPENDTLYAHVEETKIQLLYFKDDLLNFYNSYEFSNPDELMYYIVLAANELGLNLDETPLILSGEVNINDKKIHRVSDLLPRVYLNHTQIVALPQGFLPHQILLLSGLTLCELLVEN